MLASTACGTSTVGGAVSSLVGIAAIVTSLAAGVHATEIASHRRLRTPVEYVDPPSRAMASPMDGLSEERSLDVRGEALREAGVGGEPVEVASPRLRLHPRAKVHLPQQSQMRNARLPPREQSRVSSPRVQIDESLSVRAVGWC